jgi:hypothetical protein
MEDKFNSRESVLFIGARLNNLYTVLLQQLVLSAAWASEGFT